MKRIYVAGAYSADNVIDVFDNIRKGMKLSTEVLLAGYSPFCPWLDFHYILMLDSNQTLSVDEFYAYSMAWLEVSDGVLLVPGWDTSAGTLAEIARAMELDIPVFHKIEELEVHFGKA